MINTLLNLGGAYCTMCAKSQSECEDKDVIQAGFVIERDLETMKDIANALTEPDTGVITRKKGDYSTRQGICGAPLTESDLTKWEELKELVYKNLAINCGSPGEMVTSKAFLW